MKKLIFFNFLGALFFSGCASEKLNPTIEAHRAKPKVTIKSSKVAKIKRVNSKNSRVYIVKGSDTLSKIAKEHGVKVSYLKRINMLQDSNYLTVGKKLYIKNGSKHKPKTRIKLTATAYTSHKSQTDDTPFLAAWNNKIRPGMKIIAVSPDLIEKYGLKNGSKVKIEGLKDYYTVRDKMNPKFTNRIDIYMGLNKHKALQWGKRRITLAWD